MKKRKHLDDNVNASAQLFRVVKCVREKIGLRSMHVSAYEWCACVRVRSDHVFCVY